MYSENDNFDDEYDNEKDSSSSGNKFVEFYEANKKMVLILAGLVLVFVILMLMNSCSKNSEQPGNNENNIAIVLNFKEKYLNKGSSAQIIADIEPKNAYENPVYNFKSSDDSVVSVDTLGNITGLKLGNATITVSFTDDKNKPYSEECKVYVIAGDKNVKLTDIKLPNDELLMSRGDTFVLSGKTTPSNGYIEKMTFTSSNTSIVDIVDENGSIKALSDGVATVFMSVNDGAFKDEIIVNVVSDNVESGYIINPETIVFDNREITLIEGQDKKLTYQVVPFESYIGDLKWTSSNENVATVDEEGNVTALKNGTAVINVKNRYGKNDSISVKVEASTINVTGLEIKSSKNLTLNINDTPSIVVDVVPSNATNKIVHYDSNNTSVASVDSDGKIRALSSGSAVITVTTDDGDYKEFVMVTVNSNNSEGSSGGSSSGSSGSKTCDGDTLIRIDSDSGEAITTTKGGNSNTATKSTITIETDLIGTQSSCDDISEIKWCYYKDGDAECSPTNKFNVGDNLTMNVPSGSGVMILKFEAILENNKNLVKTYYMKYNVSGSSGNASGNTSGNTSGNNNSSSSSDIKLSMDATNVGQSFQEVFSGDKRYILTFTADKEFTKLLYIDCDDNKQASCNMDYSYSYSAIKRPNGEYYSNNNFGKTYYINASGKTFSAYFYASLNNVLCFRVVDSSGNKSNELCHTFKN